MTSIQFFQRNIREYDLFFPLKRRKKICLFLKSEVKFEFEFKGAQNICDIFSDLRNYYFECYVQDSS